ncbi:metal ABC transporter substrate-binding protein [Nitrospira sp. KM1]|uniref:metal ABC transporter substrate-binding protein n=1 Tax=Nitrospira sp. KM1 TaxID=1936990 RepID=UPI001562ED9C|nr:metal ABC transporter substrate-binding protein [Nitrospira sp. KM1]
MPRSLYGYIRVLVMSIISLLAGSSWAGPPQGPLNIVVTIPVLKDLAEQVGGSHVRVTSLLKGYENEHTYSPKPSDLVAVRKARLLFEVGIGLEVWVASLVKNAGSGSLQVVTTSKGIGLIRDDHGHPHENSESGNPHVWMDPQNAATMMRHITESLIQVDPGHADDYRRNQAAYLTRLDQLQSELAGRVKALKNRRFVAHHPAWPYLARRFGLQIAGTIQMQSGSEPSALHMQELIDMMKKEDVKVVVSEIQLSQKLPELLSKETGARVVVLTTLPGGIPQTDSYLDMLRYNVLQLAYALEAV